MSTLAFSGYAIEEIRALPRASPTCSHGLDVLIDGRYVARRAAGRRPPWLPANQRIQLLTTRYTPGEVEADAGRGDKQSRATGKLVLTGVNPLKLKR